MFSTRISAASPTMLFLSMYTFLAEFDKEVRRALMTLRRMLVAHTKTVAQGSSEG
jgi:hypothetical protein